MRWTAQVSIPLKAIAIAENGGAIPTRGQANDAAARARGEWKREDWREPPEA